ncbi:MAG: hypothetical protein M3442_04875 [Chloroflexota bacterium]|nr:hypothetical protein [Chloroflexota bacterium]
MTLAWLAPTPRTQTPRTRPRRALLALATLPFLSACAPPAGPPPPAGTAVTPSPPSRLAAAATRSAASQPLIVDPVVPSTDLAVGRNRFSLGLLQTQPGSASPVVLPDAQLSLTFFHPIQPQAVPRGEAITPAFRYVADKRKGLYVAEVDFDQPGDWGVEVSGVAGERPLTTARVRFTVKPIGATPAVGTAAPRSRNPTRYDVDDIRKIDTGATPNDMHELSIAAAIEQGKPLVVVFASPGFCVTQTCAPQLGEVQRLQARFGAQANFVHVEIFKDPMGRTPFETVTEWRLTSEPWTFLVDRQGLIAAKFEGQAPYAELEPALQALL